MYRVLVTGGAGFIGTNFVRHLLRETKAQVTVLDAFTHASSPRSLLGLPSDRVRVVRGDITDEPLVDRLVVDHHVVVHFAAETHNDNSLLDPAPFVRTNVLGTYTLLEAVRRYGVRYHHVSTDEVFGDLDLRDPERFTEESPYRPSSPYSATKAGSDHLVRAWVRSFGIDATVSSCSNNYGPWQHVEKLVPRAITTILDGGRPRVYGDGLNVRDWIHTEDHCAALLAILRCGRSGETYLVGADCERSNLEIVRTVLRVCGRDEDEIDFVRDRDGHDRRYAIDAAKLRTELGWRPQYDDIEAGLAATVAWYRSHEAWWRPDKARTEAAYAEAGQ